MEIQQTILLHPVNPPVNTGGSTISMLPNIPPANPTFVATCVGYTPTTNSVTLHCKYTANWKVDYSTIEVQGNQQSINLPLNNITDNSFDININSSSWNCLNCCTLIETETTLNGTAWNPLSTSANLIIPNITIVTSQGTITVSCGANQEIVISTVAHA